MSAIEIDIEIFCARCGAGICNNATASRTKGRGQPCFEIEPCETCLEKAKDEGYQEGKAEAEKGQ